MKRFLVFALFALSFCISHADTDPFKIQHLSARQVRSTTAPIRQSMPVAIPTDKPIDNLSISGHITLHSDTSLVRVILEDANGEKWLVCEATQRLLNGNSRELQNYGEETHDLCGITPKALNIYVKDAQLELTSIKVDTCVVGRMYVPHSTEGLSELRMRQVQEKVDSINAYNTKNGILWKAGITPMAQMRFSDRLDSSPLTEDYFYYYVRGIFEEGNPSMDYPRVQEDGFVKEFSWCNRHGQNWVTSVKNQITVDGSGNPMESNYCWAFATVAQLEAMFNIYFNRHIDLDLSEEDVAMHSGARNPSGGAFDNNIKTKVPLFFQNTGVALETDIPLHQGEYIQQSRPNNIPSFRISGYSSIGQNSIGEDAFIANLKRQLIANGPLASTIRGHAMLLVGYKVLEEGDFILSGNTRDTIHIPQNDPHIGQTCWIFKNSYGTSDPYSTAGNGYAYVIYEDYAAMLTPVVFYGPPFVQSQDRLPSEIGDSLCAKYTDSDGDGYFVWGKGQRPTDLPSWAEDEQDGDDSNGFLGPMNEFGILQENTYNPTDTIYIRNDMIFNHVVFLRSPLVVCNGATLKVTSRISGPEGASIIIGKDSRVEFEEYGKLQNISVLSSDQGGMNLRSRSNVFLNRDSNSKINLRRTPIPPSF